MWRLQTGSLRIAELGEAGEALERELAAFRVRLTTSGRDTYEAATQGEHDDLVISLAMAVWSSQHWWTGQRRR